MVRSYALNLFLKIKNPSRESLSPRDKKDFREIFYCG